MSEPVIELRTGLSPDDLAAISALEQRTVAADGGRLKLEWGVLNTRSPDATNDVVCLVDGDLVGFLGLYSFGHEQVELAGMVDPAHRRRGIGTALLAAARPLVDAGRFGSTLLVCAHGPASTGFAQAHGATFDHAELSMLLDGAPAEGPSNPAVTLRPGTEDDIVDMIRLLDAGFGYPPGDMTDRMKDPGTENLMIDLDGSPAGYVRLTLNGDRGGVYGFVVDPALQGRGIGRDVLRRVCQRLADAGASHVGLEVAVDNDRALGLYTSIGFRPVTTEDYFRLPSSASFSA